MNIKGKNILILGCGGGYDIFTGLPIYFNLRSNNNSNKESKRDIKLASFSFTKYDLLKQFPHEVENLYEVDALNPYDNTYFPEYELSSRINKSVYAISTDTDLVKYEEALITIVKINNIDTVIAVDGGCDSVLFGVEEDLATPVEDMMTVYLVNKFKKEGTIENAYLTCLGTNVELINHQDFIKNMEKIKENNGLVDSINLKNIYEKSESESESKSESKSESNSQINKDDVNRYINLFKSCNTNNSIINSSIVASIEGHHGRYENPSLKNRISLKENFPFLNEQTPILWIFDLEIVAKNIIYLDQLDTLKDMDDIDAFTIYMNNVIHPPKIDKWDLNELYTKERMDRVKPLVHKLLNTKN